MKKKNRSETALKQLKKSASEAVDWRGGNGSGTLTFPTHGKIAQLGSL